MKQSKFEKLRYRLLIWLRDKSGADPGEMPNLFIRIVHDILFPLHGFYASQSQVNFNTVNQTYTISGVKISSHFFYLLNDLADSGKDIRVSKDEFGTIIFTSI